MRSCSQGVFLAHSNITVRIYSMNGTLMFSNCALQLRKHSPLALNKLLSSKFQKIKIKGWGSSSVVPPFALQAQGPKFVPQYK